MQETIKQLADLRTELTELRAKERDLVNELIRRMGHDYIGQKWYTLEDGTKLFIHTRNEYTIDVPKFKKVREEHKYLPIHLQEVHEVSDYELAELMNTGTLEQKSMFSSIVRIKALNPYLKVVEPENELCAN
jgi:hypothetical protein